MKHPCGIPKRTQQQIQEIKANTKEKTTRITMFMEAIHGNLEPLGEQEYLVTWGLKDCVWYVQAVKRL